MKGTMDYRIIHKTGDKISVIGLGTSGVCIQNNY